MKKLSLFFLLILVALAIVPIFLPKSMEISLSTNIKGQKSNIYNHINNTKKFSKWSSLFPADSGIEFVFYYPYENQGSKFEWLDKSSGVGEGEATIYKANPDSLVEYEFLFIGSQKTASSLFTLKQISKGNVQVNWLYNGGKVPYFERYFSFYTKRKLEHKMRSGLAKLKKEIESKQPTIISSPTEMTHHEVKKENTEGYKVLAIYQKSSLDPEELNVAKEEALGQVISYLKDDQKLKPSAMGAPIIYYEFIDSINNSTAFYAGIPIKESVNETEDMKYFFLPSSETITGLHIGGTDSLSNFYNQIRTFAQSNSQELGYSQWEVYSSYQELLKNSSGLRTRVYIPIKTD